MNMIRLIEEGAAETLRRERQIPRPCPWCGEDPPLASKPVGSKCFIVGCESDDCHVHPQVSGSTPEEAWAFWNARA